MTIFLTNRMIGTFEVRSKFNLKYTRGRHTLNLNDQYAYSAYTPKDERMKAILALTPVPIQVG